MEDIPEAVPGRGEVLIRVHAAGVTTSELSWYPTTHTKSGEYRADAVPGHEFSGTVAALGPETTGAAIEQEVYGLNDWFTDGATAEYCLARPEWLAPKPRRLTHAEAASIPIGALTAWQGLFDRAKLQPGERVLIHGGSGGVGVLAIQLARRQGAQVITTASAQNADLLLELGARQVIDYKTTRFEDHVKDIDVVFDAVGGETLQRSWSVLGPRGRIVTIAASGEGTADQNTKAAFFIVEPNQAQLIQIGILLDAGEIRSVIDVLATFVQAGAAYTTQLQHRLGRGKVVIAVID